MVEFFQFIIIEENSQGLYPLTENFPYSKLPIANKPLLFYQLEILQTNGVKGIINNSRCINYHKK